jgi:alpha-pyrone synthase
VPVTIESIATAVPPHTRTQAEAAAFMQRVTSLPEAIRTRLPQLYDRSAIERRHSVVEDYAHDDPADFTLFPPDWSLTPAPTTAARNDVYRAAVVPLAEEAARGALAEAGRAPEEVTHLVFVSCTGFFTPGPDILLVKNLGLPASTKRTVVGFMGCYAAFNALRVAEGFVRADPAAVVLVVCAELCTLHFQTTGTFEEAVVNSLFADGCAAAVVTGAERRGTLALEGTATVMDDDSLDDMTWAVGDTGYLMGLSSRVPKVIGRHAPAHVDGLLAAHGVAREAVTFWAIHPGGRAIVEEALAALGLPESAADDSLAVLRDYGNMSSPTVLFVLQRVLARHRAAVEAGEPGEGAGVAMAFGPGLTIEGALLRGQ